MMLDHPRGRKRRQRRRKLLRTKKNLEEEAKEGCSCSSSKGCQEPEGPVF